MGTGEAYNWALRAVNGHNITNLVVMGFSYGGGATRNLLARIDQDLNNNAQPPFQRRFVVPFTAYVDAIVHRSIRGTAETNLPPRTQLHVNYHQQIMELQGGPVRGSNLNWDVNAPQINPFQLLDHTTIDDDPFVHIELGHQFMTRVNQH